MRLRDRAARKERREAPPDPPRPPVVERVFATLEAALRRGFVVEVGRDLVCPRYGCRLETIGNVHRCAHVKVDGGAS